MLHNYLGYGENPTKLRWSMDFEPGLGIPWSLHWFQTSCYYLPTVFPLPFPSGQYLPRCSPLRVVDFILEETIQSLSGFQILKVDDYWQEETED